ENKKTFFNSLITFSRIVSLLILTNFTFVIFLFLNLSMSSTNQYILYFSFILFSITLSKRAFELSQKSEWLSNIIELFNGNKLNGLAKKNSKKTIIFLYGDCIFFSDI